MEFFLTNEPNYNRSGHYKVNAKHLQLPTYPISNRKKQKGRFTQKGMVISKIP